jgi:hypothetical protein
MRGILLELLWINDEKRGYPRRGGFKAWKLANM